MSCQTKWIKLALASLIIPGITAIALVLLRTINVDQMEWGQVFKTALVIHVDLSVYIWMITGAILLWSINGNLGNKSQRHFFIVAAAGTFLIAIAAFINQPNPLLNNYIPVLESAWFFIGLGMFSFAALMLALSAFKSSSALATKLMAILYFVAVYMTAHSYLILDTSSSGYYEFLFWGGGHVLQLMVSLLMLSIWVKLYELNHVNLSSPLLSGIYLIMALPVIYALYIHFVFNIDSIEYRLGMTNMMIWGNGIAPILLSLVILSKTKLSSLKSITGISLYSSMLMFLTGGLIAIYISGINTIIPAHYHGSIVGVTLSIMGLIYYSLEKLGYSIRLKRLAYAQPIIYTIGQLMHIGGLAISGSHGAARKTVGTVGNLAQATDLSIFLTRTGGLVAILGGAIFILIVYMSLKTKQQQT